MRVYSDLVLVESLNGVAASSKLEMRRCQVEEQRHVSGAQVGGCLCRRHGVFAHPALVDLEIAQGLGEGSKGGSSWKREREGLRVSDMLAGLPACLPTYLPTLRYFRAAVTKAWSWNASLPNSLICKATERRVGAARCGSQTAASSGKAGNGSPSQSTIFPSWPWVIARRERERESTLQTGSECAHSPFFCRPLSKGCIHVRDRLARSV